MNNSKTEKLAKRIALLEERRAKISAEIQRIRAREQQKRRKEDTRRRILLGGWVLSRVQSGEWSEAELLKRLDKYLEKDRDRALFGLPPREQQTGQQAGDRDN